MAKKQMRRSAPAGPTPYEEARDELFQHIMRCGVTGSEPEHQKEWFDETMGYMQSRFPELEETQVLELRKLGERFAQPAKKQVEQDAASAA
ncbi:MAG: hypothetical protein JWO05_2127 [Gemmatimonadetes bacterium]|nr:hypothetical protein [Gemmatimonadota bacterium]